MVAGDRSRTWAVSSIDSPAKNRSSTMRACSGSRAASRSNAWSIDEHIRDWRVCRRRVIGKRGERHTDRAGTAFVGQAGTRVVDKDAAHHLCDDCVELRAVGPGRTPLIDELQVQRMHEVGGIDRMLGLVMLQLAGRDLAQFAVHERQARDRERSRSPAAPPLQQIGDVRRADALIVSLMAGRRPASAL